MLLMPGLPFLADECAKWAQAEGISQRVSASEYADLVRAFAAGYRAAVLEAWEWQEPTRLG